MIKGLRTPYFEKYNLRLIAQNGIWVKFVAQNIEISLCAKKVIFITEFAICGIFMKKKNNFAHTGISK